MLRSRPHRAILAAAVTAALLLPAPAAGTSASPATTAAHVAPAAPVAGSIALQKVADVNAPVLVTAPTGDDRLFIVTKGGRVRIVKGGNLLAKAFLDVSGNISTGSEQGLLGLAFHPAFASNRRFYVDYTDRGGDTVVREYKASVADPDVVEAGSGRTIIKIHQPYTNHNGGMVTFGADGFLYIGMGDGGSAGDPGNRAQDKTELLGKILRIDVDGATAKHNYRIPGSNPYVGRKGRDEIWQRGVRNPWRFSFDRSTGDLWIGDVGQGSWEEVDRAPQVSSGPGRGVNWGWRVMEGTHCYKPSSGCNRTGKTLPLLEYAHSNGRCSISGGYVYRGSSVVDLAGWYVYGDYCTGEVWAVDAAASRPATPVRLLDDTSARRISGFGQDAAGELYLCDLGGDAVYRIVAAS